MDWWSEFAAGRFYENCLNLKWERKDIFQGPEGVSLSVKSKSMEIYISISLIVCMKELPPKIIIFLWQGLQMAFARALSLGMSGSCTHLSSLTSYF